jgi:hypothetical protein
MIISRPWDDDRDLIWFNRLTLDEIDDDDEEESVNWILQTDEEVEAYRNNPDEIAYQKRAASNERVHCPGCGRFVKAGKTIHYYNGMFDCMRIPYECSNCGPGDIECV